MGSWGDLFPTVGLAKAVAAKGHAVRLATTSAYGSLVEDEGLRFVPVGPRYGPEEFAADPAILDGRPGGYAGFLQLFRTVVFPNLISWVEDLRGALAGADLLVSHPTVLASPIAGHIRGSVRPAHADRTHMPRRYPPWRDRNHGWAARARAATAHRSTRLRSTADRATHESPWRCDDHPMG
jgi:hypothetical protein